MLILSLPRRFRIYSVHLRQFEDCTEQLANTSNTETDTMDVANMDIYLRRDPPTPS